LPKIQSLLQLPTINSQSTLNELSNLCQPLAVIFFIEDDIEDAFVAISESITEPCLVFAIRAKLYRPQDLEVSTLCCTHGVILLQHLESRKCIGML
jgi:hypothetical protein